MESIAIIGHGSQGKAWSHRLKSQGWNVAVFGRGLSHPEMSFSEYLKKSNSPSPLVALLCPDHVIGSVYEEHLKQIPTPLTLVLAHGFAVLAETLRPQNPNHTVALLAPKVIGPKLYSAPLHQPQDFKAAVYFPEKQAAALHHLAAALGFQEQNLISVSPEKEAEADLMSEQGLLCGGLFTLVEWTTAAMRKRGLPEALIQAECFSELVFIAELLREKGLKATQAAISPAAREGGLEMQAALENSNAKSFFDAQLARVINGEFAEGYLKKFKSEILP